jgi:hypothetical protein
MKVSQRPEYTTLTCGKPGMVGLETPVTADQLKYVSITHCHFFPDVEYDVHIFLN